MHFCFPGLRESMNLSELLIIFVNKVLITTSVYSVIGFFTEIHDLLYTGSHGFEFADAPY